jgi:hypothetical protein
MFFYLTLVALDCLLAVIWWSIIKTSKGIYYLVLRYKDGTEKQIEIPNENEAKYLMDKCMKQELQIVNLTNELNSLKNNIKADYIGGNQGLDFA